MSAEQVVYSIQRTYILNTVFKQEKAIFTCDQRIDIPTIEPLPNVQVVLYPEQPITVIPCIELAGEFLSKVSLTFETNEGVTVLPVNIPPSDGDASENPYTHFRYVLVLPRGATGVKSCKVTYKDRDEEVQHNFTFGIMPPPYNYDNALSVVVILDSLNFLSEQMHMLGSSIRELKLTKGTLSFPDIVLKKEVNRYLAISYDDGKLFYETEFNYPLSSEPTIHNPKIIFHADGRDFVYTLSLSRTTNNVLIDLFTGMITVYDGITGEIMQQFKLPIAYYQFNTFRFENFDDIVDSTLNVKVKGRPVT